MTTAHSLCQCFRRPPWNFSHSTIRCVHTSGFFKSNQLKSKQGCLAWDKALYFFTNVARDYSFVWFVESDVFIPSVQAFISLHELYSPSNDLVTADNVHNFDGRLKDWPHWYLALDTLPLPWAKSMVCAMGCSRRLLSAVDEYARWRWPYRVHRAHLSHVGLAASRDESGDTRGAVDRGLSN